MIMVAIDGNWASSKHSMSYRSLAPLGSFKRFYPSSLIRARLGGHWLSPSVRSSHVAVAASSSSSLRRSVETNLKASRTAGGPPRVRADNVNGNNPQASAKSNRQLFREVPVPPSVLAYIQRIGVGIPSRSRRPRVRRRGDYQFDRSGTDSRASISSGDSLSLPSLPSPPPPPPFGPGSRVRALASVSNVADLPPVSRRLDGQGGVVAAAVPEVALVGRSNVGKSTLLNALLYGNKQRKDTTTMHRGVGKGPDKAEMSPRPGETRHVTLYHISSPATAASSRESQGGKEDGGSPSSSSSRSSLRVVDLPGYGFAYSGAQDDLVRSYLLGRDPRILKRLLLLADARHGLKQSDVEFLTHLQARSDDGPPDDDKQVTPRRRRRQNVPPIQIVLTKCDLVPQVDLARRVVLVRQRLSECLRRETGSLPVMLVAARSTLQLPPGRGRGQSSPRATMTRRDGILELQKELAALVGPWSR